MVLSILALVLTTLIIMKLSNTTFSIMAHLGRLTLRIMTTFNMTLILMTVSIMAINKMTLILKTLSKMTLRAMGYVKNMAEYLCSCVECHYSNIIILIFIMNNVIMLNVIMLNVTMLNVIMLNVIMLIVMAPL
jgi:hypothetical protein